MMMYHTIEAKCPRCGYSAMVRPDAVAIYEERCPECRYPDRPATEMYLTTRSRIKMQRVLGKSNVEG